MLRKRASFKPNLKQVAPQQPAEPSSSNPVKDATTTLEQVETTDSANQCQSNLSTPEGGQTELPTVSNEIPKSVDEEVDEVQNQHLQDAITQLTGQKFEPIKSISLRSSANKNVKLKDLLFFNPPMTKDQKRHKKNAYLAKKNEKKRVQEEEEARLATREEEEDTIPDEPSLVPKVKMGPEGKLVLDESSTIINRKNSIKEQEAIIEDHEDIISRTNYDSFRRRPTTTSQTKWSIEDTKKFYHALTILGTDFSMMESLLFAGHRSRTELHKKFKREERLNKPKIDIALSNRISVTSEELDNLREIFYK